MSCSRVFLNSMYMSPSEATKTTFFKLWQANELIWSLTACVMTRDDVLMGNLFTPVPMAGMAMDTNRRLSHSFNTFDTSWDII